MSNPTIVAVEADAEHRRGLRQSLTHRYGADYQVLCLATPDEALTHLAELRASDVAVPIIIADLRLPGMDGLTFLTRAREVQPTAKRVLLFDFFDPSVDDKITEGMTFGLYDRGITKQGFPAEEWLYPTIAELLADWSRETTRPRFEAVRVIGEQWAPRSHEIRDVLNRNSIPFGFYDVASNEGHRQLMAAGLSADRLPVVVSFRGQVAVDPTIEEVVAMLGARSEPVLDSCDLTVIGGGPAGLSAAVYGASEGLSTVIIEPVAMGGQAGTSSMIRNYLGFPEGISGTRLAQAAAMQARFFGVSWVYDEAVGLRADSGTRVVALDNGTELCSRVVIIATGVEYRRLKIPALEALIGAGVFYGAASTEARSVSGQPVYVVGAGNSAGQAALYLAEHASQVTILARGDSLAADMSDYLIRQIEAAATIAVRTCTQVVDGGGSGRLEWLALEDTRSGARERQPATAVFVLIGATPRTDWLASAVQRDPGGYILTGRDMRRDAGGDPSWSLDRAPDLLETSLPGVFAVGDVRHGATKRVATAVGDGALAVRLVHEFLANQTAE